MKKFCSNAKHPVAREVIQLVLIVARMAQVGGRLEEVRLFWKRIFSEQMLNTLLDS